MADFTINMTTEYDAEASNTILIELSSYAATMISGDRIRFNWTGHTGGTAGTRPPNIVISSFNSNAFTSNSDVTATYLTTSAWRTVLTPPTDQADTIFVDATNAARVNFVASVSSGIDTTPDDNIELGSNITSANPSSLYQANSITISGLGTGQSTTVTISGTGQVSKTGTSYTTGTLSVQNGDRVYTRMVASGSYGGSVSTTINIGGFTDSWSITNKTDPSTGTIISFGHATGSIPLSDIKAFFGGPNNLDSYRKGGTYVPAITGYNGNITSSSATSLSLLDFRNAVTALYFDQAPSNKSTAANTTSSSSTYSLSWQAVTDWTLGFGPGMTTSTEYKYVFISRFRQIGNLVVSNSDVTMTSGSDGSYSTSNTSVSIQVSPGQNVEREYFGTIRFYARKSGVESYTDVQYSFQFYGP
jgi:hypothetical protein